MKTVKQLLEDKQGSVVSIQPNATVLEALKLMADKNVGSVLILDGLKLIGIFSERDYARKVVLLGKSSKDTAVRDIMTHKVLCVRPSNTVDECMALMTQKRVRHLPVIDDKRVVGIVSIGDLVKEIIADQQLTIAQLESYITS